MSLSAVDGGWLVARQLKAEGIDTVFGVIAGPMLETFAALHDEGIRVISCRHEQGAGFMAQAWGYINRKPGVLIVGSGPAMTNAVTPMYVAQENTWPLVVLGGSTAASSRGLGGFQEAPQVRLAAPVCKWAAQADSAVRIPEYVHLALGRAVAGRPGAVYIDLSGDVVHGSVAADAAPLRPPAAMPPAPRPDPAAVDAAAALLAAAERPLMLVGKGAAWADAGSQLTRLADRGIPFVASPMGRGVIPDDHPLCVNSARSAALAGADVVLMVGGRFNWIFHFGRDRFAPDVRIVQVDIAPEEMYGAANVEIGLVADCAPAAEDLCEALDGRKLRSERSGWADDLVRKCRANQAAVEQKLASTSVPISHYRLWGALRDCLDRDATVVVDGEITLGVGRIVMPSYLPRHRLDSGTTGCMGTGVPFAVAAKLARPDRQVVAVLGDYAFGASAMEVETAARVGADAVFVIDNNAGIAGNLVQERLFGAEAERIAALLPAGYEKMAEMVGGHYQRVERPEEIVPALRRSLAAGSPSIVNVLTDPGEGIREGAGYLMG